MNFTNPYFLSVIAGLLSCLLMYVNYSSQKEQNQDNPLDKVQLFKMFFMVTVLTFGMIYISCGSSGSQKPVQQSGGLLQENFNTGHPNF